MCWNGTLLTLFLLTGLLNVVPFTSEEKMEKYFVKNKTEKYYGIVFKSEENSTDFYYKIRNKVSPLIDMQYLSYDNLFVQKGTCFNKTF